jgi:hypothetical protein
MCTYYYLKHLLMRTCSKTLTIATHGAPTPNDGPDVEGAPPAKSDVLSSKAKLLAELVTERKRVCTLR